MVTQDAINAIHLQAPKPSFTPRRDTRLYFAGEAMHKEDAYTVYGAYLSGDTGRHRSHIRTAFAAAMQGSEGWLHLTTVASRPRRVEGICGFIQDHRLYVYREARGRAHQALVAGILQRGGGTRQHRLSRGFGGLGLAQSDAASRRAAPAALHFDRQNCRFGVGWLETDAAMQTMCHLIADLQCHVIYGLILRGVLPHEGIILGVVESALYQADWTYLFSDPGPKTHNCSHLWYPEAHAAVKNEHGSAVVADQPHATSDDQDSVTLGGTPAFQLNKGRPRLPKMPRQKAGGTGHWAHIAIMLITAPGPQFCYFVCSPPVEL